MTKEQDTDSSEGEGEGEMIVVSRTEILRANSEVVLKRVSLGTATAYSVSSKRTPEVWQAEDLETANRYFDEEVGRCPPGRG